MNDSNSQQLEAAVNHHRAGRVGQAEQIYSEVLARDPVNVNALHLFGVLSHQMGRHERAIDLLTRACAIASDADASAKSVLLSDFANVCARQKRPDAAVDLYRKSLVLNPQNADASAALATLLSHLGFITDAVQLLKDSLAMKPDSRVHSNLCLISLSNPALRPEDRLAMARAWERDYGNRQTIAPHANDRAVDRPLRIGYVSPDFRRHPVRYFIHPLLANHDRARFQVHCYSLVEHPDSATAELRSLADEWRDVRGQTLDQIDALVREDEIDILVDLAGHTQDSPIALFARKPAPVQISMIGYPGTTGLSAVDYRITNANCDPPGTDAFYSEKLLRLNGSFWCFSPLDSAGPMSDLPAKSAGEITFGSVNNCSKLNDEVLDLWSKILAAIPRSRIYFQHAAFASNLARQRITTAFAHAGVDTKRIAFGDFTSMEQYLELLATFDIALDPFPFTGGATTCHLLHTGVPIVTLAEMHQISRMGASMLHSVGLPELIAESKDDYLKKAIGLANDVGRLSSIRAGLRERMLVSALCDAIGYTRKLENAYRTMWRTWCENIAR